MEVKNNLFDQIPASAPQEILTELVSANHVRVERIVSFGQTSPDGLWYEQLENEWVLVLEGSAQIRLDNKLVELTRGDYLNIPAGVRHRVEKTAENGKTVWLAVFYK